LRREFQEALTGDPGKVVRMAWFQNRDAALEAAGLSD
jgi:hypothetical protein